MLRAVQNFSASRSLDLPSLREAQNFRTSLLSDFCWACICARECSVPAFEGFGFCLWFGYFSKPSCGLRNAIAAEHFEHHITAKFSNKNDDFQTGPNRTLDQLCG
jgi:hypothetical protein